jgi:3-oxosteroid 1-dehydrogenase
LNLKLPSPQSFTLQPEYDFLIVGSGGGSMCAALLAYQAGLKVAILEKRDVVGGSTGFSGGVWWVPDNHVMKRHGAEDSPDLANRYFDAVVTFVGKGTTPARRAAFLEQAPEMIRFLEQQGMKFEYPDGWADYYDERDGGHSRGRSLMAKPFDSNKLGPWKDKLSLYGPFRGIPLGSFTMIGMMMLKRTWRAKRIAMRLGLTILRDKLLGRDVVASGGAIQARMLEMTLERNIPVFTGFATDRLVEEFGRVVGVEGVHQGQRQTVRARHGVLINSGGFARNDAMRHKYQRHPVNASWTNANPGDTGEMIEEMIRLGAETENLDAAVWVPTSLNPDGSAPAGSIGKDGSFYPFMHNADIATPNFIWVDKTGTRFVNEASSYMELGERMYEVGATPGFAIFDETHMRRYPYGPLLPGMKPVKKWLEDGFLIKADTIEDLASKAGINPAGLRAQIQRYNSFAQSGIDEEFHKGERAYDRFRGDPTIHPNPCMGPIAQAPFYAVRIFPGDVGTFGGVVTDEVARVLRQDGSIIDGLYATGNCTSSVMGRTYPGAGASISPSFTFGYIAAKDIVAKTHNAPTRT